MYSTLQLLSVVTLLVRLGWRQRSVCVAAGLLFLAFGTDVIAQTNATGGTVTTSGGYTIHTFTGSGTFTVTSPIASMDVVVVGGGGGGGHQHAGGGGAGGVITLTGVAPGVQAYSIVVGNGGAGCTWYPYTGQNGGNSSAFGYTAVGGGAGTGGDQYGNDGGSGGADGYPSGGMRGGFGTSGQGNLGNRTFTGSAFNGGGGGGAGSAGSGMTGGLPLTTWAGTFAGGGGGGFGGGSGGGAGAGNGGYQAAAGGNAAANTGSGGGGGGNMDAFGGNGGSGIVVIRYVYNAPPTTSWHTLPPAPITSGAWFPVRATGSDANGNLGGIWVEYSVNGGAWTGLAYDPSGVNGGNGYNTTSNNNGITAGAPGTTYQFRCYAWDQAGANSGWQYSAVYTVASPPTAAMSINGLSSGTTSALLGDTLTINVSGADADNNLRAVNLWVLTPTIGWRNIRADSSVNGGYIENTTTDNAINSAVDVSSLGPAAKTFTVALGSSTGTYSFVTRSIDSYGAISGSQQVDVLVSKRSQSALTLNAVTTQSLNATQTLSVSGGTGTGGVSYAIVGQSAAGVATLSGASLTANSPSGWVDLQATNAGDANYNSISSGVVRVSFTKASASVTLASLAQAYSGTSRVATATTSPAGLSVTFTYNGSATAPTSAGSYTVVGTINDTNYAGSSSSTLVVSKVALTVTANNATRAYGAGNPSFSASFAGFVNGETSSVISGAASFSTPAVATSVVGSYAITPSAGTLSATNYSFGTFTAGTLSVTPAALTVTANNASKTYGAANPTFSASYTGFANGETAAVVAGSPSLSTTATTTTGAGSVAITAAIGTLSANNYTFGPFVNGTLTINKAVLTVSGNNASRTYGAANPTFTSSYTGFVNGDTTSVISGSPAYSTTAVATSAVGSYPITLAIGSLSSANYNFGSFTAATLTVSKAPLSVTANNTSKITGTPNPTFTATIAGFVNGETTSVVSGAASLTTTAVTSSPAGTYPITAAVGTLSATNYTFTPFVNGTLTVASQLTQAPLNFAPTTTQAYQTSQTLSTTGGSGTGAVSYAITGQSAAGVATLTAPNTLTANVASGWVDVQATKASDGTYAAISSSVVRVTFSKASATVTITNLSQTYNGSTRPVTVTTNPASLTVDLTYNGSTTVPTNAGSYTVVGTINNTNYQGTSTVTLVVAKASATVTLGSLSQTYNGSARSATATTSPAGKTVTFTYDGSATAPTNAGSYAVVGTISDTNYAGSASGTLVVAKATGTVTLSGLSKTYNGAAQSAGATTSPTGKTVLFTYNGSGTAPTNAGSYAVVGTISDTNYAGSASGTMTIAKANQAALTMTAASPQTFGAPQTLTSSGGSGTGTVSFAINAQSATGAATLAGATLTPNLGTGWVDLQATKASDSNYNSISSGITRVIFSKAQATVTLSNLSQTYDGAAKPVEVTTAPSRLNIDVTYGGTATVPVNAGSYAVVATVNDANYTGTTSGTLLVNPAPQTVVVSPSAPRIVFGSSTTLTASGAQNGYTWGGIVSGAVPSVTANPTGAGSFSATVYSPAGGNYARSADVTVPIVVDKATPTGAFAGKTVQAPYTISAGDLAATFVHSFSTTVAAPTGAVTYSPTAGSQLTAGTHTITATYPGDGNYNPVSVTATFIVNKTTPTVSWSPGDIAYGATYGPAQLNATASVPGTFDYMPASGMRALAVGPKALTVTFTPTDSVNYYSASATANINVTKATQSINFSPASPVTYTVKPYGLAATATSGLPVSYSVSSLASVNGGIITVLGAGDITVTASQAGDGNYYSAPNVVRTIHVNQATQTITFPSPNLSQFVLKATSSSGLPITYSSSNPSIAVIDSLPSLNPNLPPMIFVRFIGNQNLAYQNVTIYADQPGDTNFLPAPQQSQSLTMGYDNVWLCRPPDVFAASNLQFQLRFSACTTQSTNVTLCYRKLPSTSWTEVGGAGGTINTVRIVSGGVTFSQPGSYEIAAMDGPNKTFPIISQSQVSLTVVSDQTITFQTILNSRPQVGDQIALNATASSNLPVSFDVVSGPATINGSVLTVTNWGAIKVRAKQAGNSQFAPALDVTQTIVAIRPPTLSLDSFTNPTSSNPNLSGSGYAFDAQDGAPVPVLLYLDGTALPASLITNGLARPTVQSQSVANGWSSKDVTNCGWSFAFDTNTIPYGTHTYFIQAFNNGGGIAKTTTGTFTGGNPLLVAQTLTFDPIPDKEIGDPDFAVNAKSNLGYEPTYAIVSGPATLVAGQKNVVHLGTSKGVVVIQASHPGVPNKAGPATATKTFVLGSPDANGNLVDDDWELRYGLDLNNTNAVYQTAPNGYTYIDNFNSFSDPTVARGGGSGMMVPIEINAVGKPSGPNGTVTITVNGKTKTYTFPSANTWQGDATLDTTQFYLELGKPYSLQVSTSGMTDYAIVAKPDPDVSPGFTPIAEFAGSTLNTSFVDSISQAELGSVGSSPTIMIRREGSIPFGELDTSRFETSRILTLGLGGSRSGESPSVLGLGGEYAYGGTGGLALVKGPGVIQIWQPTLSHLQVQVPAGFVDVVRTRKSTTTTYYANGSYTETGGYKDFSTATPLVSYKIDGLLGGIGGKVTRTSGGVTTLLEYEFSSSESVDGPTPQYDSSGALNRFVTLTYYTSSLRTWGWHAPTAARSGLIVSKSQSSRQVQTNPNGSVIFSSDGPITQTIARYLGSTEASPVGSTEYRTYNPGDTAMINSVSVQRGGPNEPSQGRWAEPGSTLQLSWIKTANGKGGSTLTEYYSRAQPFNPNNLAGQPTFVIGEPKSIRESVGNDAPGDASALVTTYVYKTDALIDWKPAPDTVKTFQGAVQIGGSSYSYNTGSLGGFSTIVSTISTNTQSGSSLTKTVKNFSRRLLDIDRRGKPVSVVNADQTKVSYAYQRGTLDNAGTWTASVTGPHLLVAELNGTQNGTANVSSYPDASVPIDPLQMDANRSTVAERIFDDQGHIKREASYVYTSSGFVRLASVTSEFDGLGHLTKKTDASGRVLYEAVYAGVRKTWEADESGITLNYTYNDYDQVETMKRASGADGANVIAETTTRYAYDEIGRLKSESLETATETLTTSYTFDIANRPTSRTLPGSIKTTIVYDSPTQSTTTLPGGGTKIEKSFADGRPDSVSGTAVAPVSYSYTYDPTTGNLKTTQTTGSQSVTTEMDWVGRTLKASTGTYDGNARVVNNSYNGSGQLERQETRSKIGATETEIAPAHVYSYDTYGRLQSEGLKTGTGTTPNPATDYDVKVYEFAYQTGNPNDPLSSNYYRYDGVKIYPFDGTGATTYRYGSQTYTQLTGLSSTTTAHVVSLDYDRNKTDTTSTIDRDNKRLTVGTTADGTSQTLQQVSVNGLPVKSTNAQGQTVIQTYDTLSRLEASSDPRIGETTYTYVPGTNLVDSVTTPDNIETAYAYDSGRIKAQARANKTDYFEYDGAGRVTYQWGDSVNPVKYVYNSLGQKTEMYTYRSGTWTGSTRPISFDTGGDKTTWTYQAATGLLLSKKDAANSTTSYEYNDLGQMRKRTDGRGWVTNYEYTDPRKMLSKVDYTGTAETVTTDVSYVYDRAGRMSSVTDRTGQRSFSYYDYTGSGTDDSDLLNKSARLKQESLTSYFGSHTIGYNYQFGVGSRINGALTGVKLDTGALYAMTYAYDSVLRMNSVQYNANAAFTYTYVPNSNLIDTVTQGPSGYSRDYDYEVDLQGHAISNRIGILKHGWNATSSKAVESRVTYRDALRETEKTQGSDLMTALGRSGVHVDYTYNGRRELEDSGKYPLSGWGDPGAVAPLTGTIRAYDYDPIGNRTSDQNGTYTPNALNQYSAAPNFGAFVYDENGNMKSDGIRTYDYDAENRLIKVTQGASVWNYEYDYLGRRIRKSGTGISDTKFVYDGWNSIAELNGGGTLGRKFAWGLDASGSLQGAGGVGGLLTLDTGSVQYLPIYDASHNVVGLYDGSGTLAAAYEYDPFGNLQRSAGGYSDANPFRSATKYTDTKNVGAGEQETGLIYYGHRFYSAQLGRFINRDPIEESGGTNLYGFCANDGVNRYDVYGLDPIKPGDHRDVFDEIKRFGGAGSSASDNLASSYSTTQSEIEAAQDRVSAAKSVFNYDLRFRPDGKHWNWLKSEEQKIAAWWAEHDRGISDSARTFGYSEPGTFNNPDGGWVFGGHYYVTDELTSRTPGWAVNVDSGIAVDFERQHWRVSDPLEDAFNLWSLVTGVRALGSLGVRTVAAFIEGLTAVEREQVILMLKYKMGWTPAQIAAADAKVAALNDADLAVTKSHRSGTSAARRYKRGGGTVPKGSDVDHVVDLQLGGEDIFINLAPLDASVNRSLGRQIQWLIKNLPPGTKIDSILITH